MSKYNVEEEVAYFDLKHKNVITTKVKGITYCYRSAQDRYHLENGSVKYEHEIWKPMKKEFKELKDYLKPGYVVEYEDGDKHVIIQDVHGNVFGIEIGGALTWTSLTAIDEIVAVYQINHINDLHLKCNWNKNLTKVWERAEVELTMQEIADKFGIDVNQLKIKK